mmetsp:Transcript_23952/g.35174  ORF Transcript_23952/g.35174 Transcript_23952/m.35174 type:complete len:213 (-) Transcript_23952:334-972(-)
MKSISSCMSIHILSYDTESTISSVCEDTTLLIVCNKEAKIDSFLGEVRIPPSGICTRDAAAGSSFICTCVGHTFKSSTAAARVLRMTPSVYQTSYFSKSFPMSNSIIPCTFAISIDPQLPFRSIRDVRSKNNLTNLLYCKDASSSLFICNSEYTLDCARCRNSFATLSFRSHLCSVSLFALSSRVSLSVERILRRICVHSSRSFLSCIARFP